ncbi:hypothetical protein GCK32_016859 [Trichostrongylus colubriformis]|uniref:Uncharacterized protein n=1 Tax=Trichostrongylus colubriformis TaxID=6319 RepID=A0AAN8I905_TRICO
MLELLMHLFCIFGSILAINACTQKREGKREDHMPIPKMQAQTSITTTSSTTHTDNHSKDKALRKIGNKESNKQEKSAKAVEKTQRTIIEKNEAKRCEETTNKKSEQKEKKADNQKKEQIMKTEATQAEPSKENNAREAIKSPAVFSYKVSPVLKSPIESERAENVQKTLALLAAAEQMAMEKGDYDNFGPPVKPTKKT